MSDYVSRTGLGSRVLQHSDIQDYTENWLDSREKVFPQDASYYETSRERDKILT